MLILSDMSDTATTSATAKLHLTKVQATGNDFLLVLDPDGLRPLRRETVAALCDRRLGIGADGMIRAVRSASIPEGACLAASAEWFMDYVNADGSVAEMCGNGVRAFVRYLVHRELVSGRLAVGTRAGVRWVERVRGGFRIDMGPWRITGRTMVRADGISERRGLAINLGNPHVVVPVSGEELAALRLAQAPALDPPAPEGANVEFVVTECTEGMGRVRMRVSERGVGETLSCGTGSVAAALAAREWAGGVPNVWEVRIPGGVVEVEMTGGEKEQVTLAGPAEVVFDGEFTFHHP
ncbi:Diaminopimelate epimerase [Cutaneotrichosporon oleaginosum]|uniref:diaminopimelate epimerase n=1 Tax=Cutaneotrichosporon oleaginosum TaxID=879819 RepID=A0A0J1B0A6_9TREE|nr:Diaminopimelate epimerase [Cutaneotrichosporon oleaginosum]KLT41019.1 Diaminopimelate epimerase [Cutaneotrichosporon oleaginosum]TXT12111.1 hypothetical protein COLE_02521 [Cutaneotrichosporon oleaginosum]